MKSCLLRIRAPIVMVAIAAATFAQSAAPAPASADAGALEIGRAYQRYQEQLRTMSVSSESDAPWWRTPYGTTSSPGTREKIARAQREFHDSIRSLLGAEPIPSTGRDSRYSFLPEPKQALVAHVDLTYAERVAEIRRDAPNIRLPADNEKMKQLAATREGELLAILTREEFERLDMRTSTSSMTVRQRFGEAIESEDEFRKVFVLQKAFDEKYPIEDAIYSSRQQELMRQRGDAERKLLEEIQQAVGEERYAVFRRAMDQDFQSIRAIVRRLNLPETAIEGAMKIRDNYAMQSMTINAETSLNFNDRRALLQDLAKEARKELSQVMTPPGLEAYGSRAQWIRYLEQGMAFSTNPKDSSSSYFSPTQSTYMVSPSGVTITTPGTITTSPAGSTPSPGSAPSATRQTRPAGGSGGAPAPKAATEKSPHESPPPPTPKP